MTAEQRPADPAAVAADDARLDALSTARLTDDTDETFRLLADWRREVRAEPVPELVDTDTAVAAIEAGHRRRRRPRRYWLDSVTAAVAVLVIVFAALGWASESAQPGDWLYPLREVLYGEVVAR